MTPKEALRFMGRYTPCDHSDTATVGYGDTKCLECGRIWPKGEDVTYTSYRPQPDARIIPSVYIGSGGTVIAGGSMDTLQYIREEGDD